MNIIERNKNIKKKFEKMINTADNELAKELIADNAIFYTPASHEPLYGGSGYLSVVHWLRKGFSNAKWKMENIVADETKSAVLWVLTGVHDGEFMGIKPTGSEIKTTVMNFYFFNNEGKIINDIAAEGMIGILKPIGLCK